MPGVENIGQLFEILESRRYPRLAVTDNQQQHRALRKICKDIAAPFERARIAKIDWSDVLEALKS